MERKYTVYMHRNKVNGKVYIGQTKQNVEQRWRKGEGYISSSHFYSAIQKYGWDNFEHIILHTNLTSIEADYFETQYIKEYDATNPKKGYNLRTGGKENFSISIQAKENRTNIPKLTGEQHPMSKKVRCKETGDIFPSIHSAELWSDSVKVGECCRGNRKHAGFHPLTGIQLSWEYANSNEQVTINCIAPIKNRHPKKYTEVVCLNNNKVFNSAKEAATWCGLKDASNINRCCSGQRASAGKHPVTKEKLKWKFKED